MYTYHCYEYLYTIYFLLLPNIAIKSDLQPSTIRILDIPQENTYLLSHYPPKL
jgi:hypothetical protein